MSQILTPDLAYELIQGYQQKQAYNDYIFATLIEEYGLIGGTVVMMLYLLFLWRSILIFKRCPFAFGAFLAPLLQFPQIGTDRPRRRGLLHF